MVLRFNTVVPSIRGIKKTKGIRKSVEQLQPFIHKAFDTMMLYALSDNPNWRDLQDYLNTKIGEECDGTSQGKKWREKLTKINFKTQKFITSSKRLITHIEGTLTSDIADFLVINPRERNTRSAEKYFLYALSKEQKDVTVDFNDISIYPDQRDNSYTLQDFTADGWVATYLNSTNTILKVDGKKPIFSEEDMRIVGELEKRLISEVSDQREENKNKMRNLALEVEKDLVALGVVRSFFHDYELKIKDPESDREFEIGYDVPNSRDSSTYGISVFEVDNKKYKPLLSIFLEGSNTYNQVFGSRGRGGGNSFLIRERVPVMEDSDWIASYRNAVRREKLLRAA